MKTTALILTVSLLGLTQCALFDWNDDDQQPVVNQLDLLPPPTQEGKFTFGCLVNGQAWVPRTTTRMTSFYQGGTLYIAAEFKGKGKEQNMQLVVNDTALSTNIAYDLTTFPNHSAEFFWYYIDKNICTYAPKNVLSGTLTLTHFDRVNYIVSGVFEFTTAKKGCETIRVTDGRFDMQYVP
jgi:hypothetical protein